MSVEDLAARVAQLEATVADLRRRLDRRDSRTMKQTLRCTCGGTTFVHFRRVYVGGSTPFGLGYLHKALLIGRQSVAPVEAYACRACGLVEFHVIDFEDVNDSKDVVEVAARAEPEPPDDPYR